MSANPHHGEELRKPWSALWLRLRCLVAGRNVLFTILRYGASPVDDGCTFWVVAPTLTAAQRLAAMFDTDSVRTKTRRSRKWYASATDRSEAGVIATKRWGPAEWGDWWDIQAVTS